ncbi:hydrolase [Spiroplasma corruscae]|uniref:Hydrolase n=1 Tax=Spiroplasma corruscae TaxID=216934 RepID=A0A222ENF7_9MOLU|nr:alpha/beta fold hydrolase [Spiroplasma corruscae]ASP28017.1 hydrolase [Spiroplasma corruscae]
MDFLIENLFNLLNKRNIDSRDYLSKFKSVDIIKLYEDAVDNEIGNDFKLNIDYNLIKETSFKSFDDKELKAIYSKNKKSKVWVVSLHGYSSSKESSFISSYFLSKLGFNLFSFDFRNHGSSDPSPITLGVHEHKDLEAALTFLNNNFKVKKVILIGYSMGAHVLNRFALSSNYKKYKVKLGISDSTFLHLNEVLKTLLSSYVKILNNKMSEGLVKKLLEMYNKKHKIDVLEKPIFETLSICKKSFPILFIHSKQDQITSYKDSEKIYEMRKHIIKKDQIKVFETGEHIRTFIEHNHEYMKMVYNFVNKNK